MKEVEKEIAADRQVVKDGVNTETNADKHALYMQLPACVVLHIARAIFVNKEWTQAMLTAGASGDLNKLSAVADCKDIKLPKDVAGLDLNWIVKRIEAGWNVGQSCSDFSTLNRLAAYYNQLEFIPVGFTGKEGYFYYAHKVRYDSVPYLPFNSDWSVAPLAFKFDGKGLVVRPIPKNLVTALAAVKTVYKPHALAKRLLERAGQFFPDLKNVLSLAMVLGKNLATLQKTYSEVDVNIALALEPVAKAQSIFAGPVLSEWISFFEGFSHDGCGTVSAARALASYGGFKGFYGQLSNIAVWLNQPCTLKVPNKLEVIVKHTYVDFKSFNEWPSDCCVYNPTPGELNAYLSLTGKNPAALAMPLTAVLTNTPQVDTYCKRFGNVLVTVLFSDPPTVVFQPTKKGLCGYTMKDNLARMEKAIVKGFLSAASMISGDYFIGFQIVAADDYAPELFHIRTKMLRGKMFNTSAKRYVSMDDAELRRYVPTARVGDVKVDDMDAGAKFTMSSVPQYPRVVPNDMYQFGQPIKITSVYMGTGAETGVKVSVNLTNWTKASGVTIIKAAEGLDECVVLEDPLKPRAEAEEGEVKEDAAAAAEGHEGAEKKAEEEDIMVEEADF